MSLFRKKYEPFMTDYRQYNKKYVNKVFHNNIILSQHAMLDTAVPTKNCNNRHVCVLDAADYGTGYMLANILQANCNYIIPDVAGELYELTGDFLRSQGYDVQVIDLSKPNNGAHYNPLQNLGTHTEAAIVEFVQVLFQHTCGEPATEKDRQLLFAMILYVLTLPQAQQNLSTVYNMLDTAHQQQDCHTIEAHVQETLRKMSSKALDAWANHADESLEESVRKVREKLSVFSYEYIVTLTSDNTLDLNTLHQGKQAIFIIDCGCCNELQVILYNQILRHCETRSEDETQPLMVFLNKSIPELAQRLYYLYTQKTHVALLYPSVASIKRDYPEHWDSVIGACDNWLYLGGQGLETLEYISKQLGYRPIDMKAIRRHHRKHKYVNYNIVRREVLTPNEVSRIPQDKCIVMVKMEKPFLDAKYSIHTHPNVQYLNKTELRGYYEKL